VTRRRYLGSPTSDSVYRPPTPAEVDAAVDHDIDLVTLLDDDEDARVLESTHAYWLVQRGQKARCFATADEAHAAWRHPGHALGGS